MRTSVLTPYAAYLRVYEPLSAFPEPERTKWADYIATRGLPDPTVGLAAEHEQSRRHVVATPPITVPPRESEEAFVLAVDGQTLVCPWQTRLRSWVALQVFRRELPRTVVDACLPRVVQEQAEADFERWRAEHADLRPRILTSTWHVPLQWFVLFAPEERSVRLAPGPPRAAYYRTRMVEARRRVARALHTLRRTMEENALTLGLEEVGRWLEEFHPKSWVELDYGGLVHLLPDKVLESDDSVAEVAAGLAALARGDVTAAAEAYERLMTRWRAVQALERAN